MASFSSFPILEAFGFEKQDGGEKDQEDSEKDDRFLELHNDLLRSQMKIPRTRTVSGRRMIETKKRSRPWDGLSWIVLGEEVLGWMEMRSASSVSQFTALRNKFPFPEVL